MRQLLELYCYDFSEYTQADINAHGFYDYKYLDYYWTEKNRWAYFIKVNNKYAGFVLVNTDCFLNQLEGAKTIAEFFVLRKYRRQGIGKTAAHLTFDKFPGKWEVAQHPDNKASIKFWNKVIKEKFNPKTVFFKDKEKRVMLFENSKTSSGD